MLNWFKENSDLEVDYSLEEIAKLARMINLELNKKNKSPKIIKQAQELVAILKMSKEDTRYISQQKKSQGN